MKILLKGLLISTILVLFISCSAKKVYTSASYGSLKSYTEKPIYNGKKETSTYVSGSLSNLNHPQNNESDDKVTMGNFSIYRTTTDKRLNYYYGLGGSFGTYQFRSDLTNLDNSVNYFSENDKLNFYNINLKAGVNLTKTWKKFEYSIIGVEFVYVNEFGSYIDKLSDLPQMYDVAIVDEKSIFAFNLNTEITFRINKDNNIGYGMFLGDLLFLDKEKTRDENGLFYGFILKYNYKNFTISLIKEYSKRSIESTRFGITYKLLNKSKSIKVKENADKKRPTTINKNNNG
ncbi:MAG: hypothetical protein L3J23_06430 [Flavobacteriaceae bacterium]|nr:hypothetical protein [Flavobacteriaceae bacterium]